MNTVPIHITPHGIELSLGLRKFVERKMSRLSRFAADILSAEVVLREKSGADGVFSVSARLALPGRDVNGNAVDKNFYTAVNGLVARLVRLSRKRKTHIEKGRRRASRFQGAIRSKHGACHQTLPLEHREKLSEPSIMSLSPKAART